MNHGLKVLVEGCCEEETATYITAFCGGGIYTKFLHKLYLWRVILCKGFAVNIIQPKTRICFKDNAWDN